MLDEIRQNYAQMTAGHPAANSVTKKTWFHRWFSSTHG